jgi:hypothetical protein
MNNLVDDKDNSIIVAEWTYGYQSLLYNDIPILIHRRYAYITKALFYFKGFYFTKILDETSKILNYVAGGNVEKINEKKSITFQILSKDLLINQN